MGLTADGEVVTYTLSEDGQAIVATAGGEPVFTMSLSDDGGDVSYTFELQGNLDHPDAGSDVISNLPFGLTVTDGDGSTASAEIKINVVDDQPEAVGEVTLSVDEGGNTVGSADGGANLLSNDDVALVDVTCTRRACNGVATCIVRRPIRQTRNSDADAIILRISKDTGER